MGVEQGITEFARHEARLDFPVADGTVAHDEGVVDLVRVATGKFNFIDTLPPIIEQNPVASESFGCGDCIAANSCDRAVIDADNAYTEGIHWAYNDPDISNPGTAIDSRTRAYEERLAYLSDFENAAGNGACKGGERITVETTYVPWDYLKTGELSLGAVRQQIMRWAGKDTATHTRVVTVCGNPVKSPDYEGHTPNKKFLR